MLENDVKNDLSTKEEIEENPEILKTANQQKYIAFIDDGSDDIPKIQIEGMSIEEAMILAIKGSVKIRRVYEGSL